LGVNKRNNIKEGMMPKATITLPNGSIVVIEGQPEEINKVLKLYSLKEGIPQPLLIKPRKGKRTPSTSRKEIKENKIDYAQIINKVKDCDEAIEIEKQILDKPSQVNRILLPLYIVHEYFDNSISLTSGDIHKITTDLGIPISQVNASHSFSGTTSRYVIGDKLRKKGQPVRYKLSKRGLQYLKSVISGEKDDNKA
jgi:hypothetical protein